jgi:hypothetical protein
VIKLIDILKEIESNKILVPRRSEERKEKLINLTNEKIQQYIKNGGKGDLDLSSTPITSIPDTLVKVGGNLFLNNTQITSLHNNLQVDKSLLFLHTKIKSLPDNLKVGEQLYLSFSKINSLPDNLQVDGTLSLYDTPLAKKYNSIEIKQMIEDKGGYVKGAILGGKAIE